jgi:hypothetical protein
MQFLRNQPLAIIPLFLALYGFATIDVRDFIELSAAPLSLNSEVTRQFLQFSPLTYFLGYPFTRAVGGFWSFVLVMAGGLAAFTFALQRFASIRYGARQNDAILMLFAAPLLIVLTQYVGKSDAYLVALLLLLAISRNPVWQALLSCLVVTCHFEMGLLVLGSAVFLQIVPIRGATIGGLAGAALVYLYHHYLLPAPPTSRADVGLIYLADSVNAVLATPVLHLTFMFGPFWWCVSKVWPADWRWLVMLAGTTVIASVTLDFTRVFVLVGLPLIIVVIDRITQRVELTGERPRWMHALPLFAFFQAHLISGLVFDSRMPKLVGRLIAAVTH